MALLESAEEEDSDRENLPALLDNCVFVVQADINPERPTELEGIGSVTKTLVC